ncbi:caspase-1-like [Arctopsyche grandis]|uniref:caspase-1-like n=1 Tax=Arctopsyche grandis TaxID=121162 RepID=UPI00406D8C7A
MDPKANNSNDDNQTRIDASVAIPVKSRLLPSRVKNLRKFDPESLYYDLQGKGLAVIFNHVVYNYSYYPEREGTTKDVERLEKCLKMLNFDIKTYNDLSRDDIDVVMKAVANLKTTQMSCLVIVVMTHGENGFLAAFDKIYPSSVLWKDLIGKLVGIPKLFFIQSCRGSDGDVGVEVTDSEIEDKTIKLPSIADFLFMYSAPEGFVSYIDKSGSWFIKTLCKELEDKHKNYDLLQILTIVNKRIALDFEVNIVEDKSKIGYKSIPQIVSMLTKFLKFNPSTKAGDD